MGQVIGFVYLTFSDILKFIVLLIYTTHSCCDFLFKELKLCLFKKGAKYSKQKSKIVYLI